MERRLASPVIVLLFILLFFCLGCVLLCCVGTYAFYAIGTQIDAGTMDVQLLGFLVGVNLLHGYAPATGRVNRILEL